MHLFEYIRKLLDLTDSDLLFGVEPAFILSLKKEVE
jgi:hypothetical protein